MNSNSHNEEYDTLRWRYAVENSGIGVWDFNAATNTVFFSQSSKAIIGFEDDPTFGDHLDDWNDRVHPDDREKYFKDYQDHINGLIPFYNNIHRVRCKDGSYKWILDKGKIVEKDAQGSPTRFIGTHVDITDRIENENNLAKTLGIVSKQNNKLQNFAHIVTHNLKQHAANFESLLDFYEEATLEEEKSESISYLKSLSTSLTNTINNLNEIVSIQHSKSTKIKKLFLTKEIDTIINMLDVVIRESKAGVSNRVDPSLYIHYNLSYLESIIQNLLTNAIKYKHPERHPKIQIDSIKNAESIEIKVSDNGIGIDLEKYGDDIFGLYRTFHNNENSEGVGLYLIKSQVEAFGGKISVASKVNVGTTFTITMPNKKQ